MWVWRRRTVFAAGKLCFLTINIKATQLTRTIMSKLPLAICIIVICCLLAAPLLALPILNAPDNPQADPQNPMQPTPQATSKSTQQDNPKQTPQNEPVSAPNNKPTPTQPSPSPTNAPQKLNRTLSEALGNATNFFADTKEPHALLMLDVINRRFGINDFNNSLMVFDDQLATKANFPEAPMLRVLRRMADYSNTIVLSTDFDAVSSDIDLVTVPALYSDRLALPADYNSTFHNAVDSGGYLLTHALLATVWFTDNHYNMSLSNDYMDALYHANAAIIVDDNVITDLKLEAAAFLCLAGQSALVNDSFIQRVIAVQNPDGGWSSSSDDGGSSYWHSSVLGLMLLLHVQYPDESYPPVLSPAEESN